MIYDELADVTDISRQLDLTPVEQATPSRTISHTDPSLRLRSGVGSVVACAAMAILVVGEHVAWTPTGRREVETVALTSQAPPKVSAAQAAAAEIARRAFVVAAEDSDEGPDPDYGF